MINLLYFRQIHYSLMLVWLYFQFSFPLKGKPNHYHLSKLNQSPSLYLPSGSRTMPHQAAQFNKSFFILFFVLAWCPGRKMVELSPDPNANSLWVHGISSDFWFLQNRTIDNLATSGINKKPTLQSPKDLDSLSIFLKTEGSTVFALPLSNRLVCWPRRIEELH